MTFNQLGATMKKIILLLILVFGFSLSGISQEIKQDENTANEVEAKALAIKIKDYLNLDSAKTRAVMEIVTHKRKATTQEPNLIEERRIVITNKFTKKLQGTLSKEEFEKLKSNKSLFEEFQKF